MNTNGLLTQTAFNMIAAKDLFRAVWLAQHMGVAKNVTKAWVSAILAMKK